MDQREIGSTAVAHLLGRGRTRIGVVMPEEPGLDLFADPRLAGARTAAEGTGARIEPLPLAYEEESRRPSPPAGARSAWTPSSRTTTSTRCS